MTKDSIIVYVLELNIVEIYEFKLILEINYITYEIIITKINL